MKEDKNVLYIGNKLAGAGFTPTLIDTLGPALEKMGYRVTSVSSSRNKVLRLLNMLWTTLFKASRVDVVLIDTYSTQNFYYAVAVGTLCRLLKKPYIPILHGGDLPKRLKNSRSLSDELFNGARTNVAPSKYLLEHFKKAGFENLLHIPNSIDLSRYTFKQRDEIAPRLLWVRSFAGIYNPTLALEVVEQLAIRGIEVQLTMVGPDKDGSLDSCKNAVAQKRLPVTFTGKLDKQEWLDLSSNFDIFINTTNFDNMPVSVIEAMALGLPVVSTNVGGLSYLIDDDKDGLLVPAGDVLSFVQAIEVLLADRDLVVRLTKAAREKVSQFDWEVVKIQWKELLDA